MPLRWDVAELDASSRQNDDAVWAIEPYRFSDIARGGVSMVLCDSKLTSDDEVGPCQIAASTFDAFYYTEMSSGDGDPVKALTYAIRQALFTAQYDPAHWQNAVKTRPEKQLSPTVDLIRMADAISGDRLTMIAAAAHHGILYVAYTGENQAYLYRNGQLELLTVDPSTESGVHYIKRELRAKDYVLLCTRAYRESVYEAQIDHVFETEKRTKRAVNALLDAVTLTRTSGVIGVGVIRNMPFLAGMLSTGAFSSAALVILAVVIFALLALGQHSLLPNTNAMDAVRPSATPAPPTRQPPTRLPSTTPKPTITQLLVAITPTLTATPTAQPTLTPTASATPEPTSTTTPPPTPTATATSTATATPRPIRRLPTITPTPLPIPTGTAVPLPTLTATPRPQPTSPPPPPPQPTAPPQPTSPPPPPPPPPTTCPSPPPGGVC